jgi:hypothetical protein
MWRAAALALAFGLWFGVAPAAHADSSEEQCTGVNAKYLPEAPPVFAQLGIADAHTLSQGDQVRVAVVAGGVDANHPHLEGVLAAGKDFTAGGSAVTTDSDGLGTQIASLIAATPQQGSGLTGVAPKAKIVPVKVYAETTSNDPAYGPDEIAQGIDWAAGQAQIIVVPLAITQTSPALRQAVDKAVRSGSLVVASAGDSLDKDDPLAEHYPAHYPEVLAVTAVGSDGTINPNAPHGEYVDIAVPGQNVPAAQRRARDCLVATDAPSAALASGYAAGIAALVAAKYPAETVAGWEYRLLVTASRPRPEQRTDELGWGIVAPYSALNFIDDGTALGPHNTVAPTPSAGPARLPATPPDHSELLLLAVGAPLAGAGVILLAAGLITKLVAARRQRPATPNG